MAQRLTLRADPIFRLETPLLFAHRGGALEAPENTLAAFKHAKKKGADVLELDVHTIPIQADSTKRTLVVWHGPSLHNVRLNDDARRRLGSTPSIENAVWSDFMDSQVAPPNWPLSQLDLLPDNPDARIIQLEELLAEKELSEHPLNIEMKKETFIGKSESETEASVEQLQDLLRDKAGNRRIVLASQSKTLLDLVDDEKFAKSLSIKGGLRARAGVAELEQNRVLQIPWWPIAAPPWLIRQVHKKNSACHVFITDPLGIDSGDGEPTEKTLFRLLDRGVDGVMTDRPSRVRELIDQWRKAVKGE